AFTAERLAAQFEKNPGKFGAMGFAHKKCVMRKITCFFYQPDAWRSNQSRREANSIWWGEAPDEPERAVVKLAGRRLARALDIPVANSSKMRLDLRQQFSRQRFVAGSAGADADARHIARLSDEDDVNFRVRGGARGNAGVGGALDV